MPILIHIGRLLMVCVWLFLLSNIIKPFPHPLNIFVNVALIFMVIMHGLQLAMLKATQTKDEPSLSTPAQLKIFIFGVFELLVWKKKLLEKK